ncbi:class I SAM-dependent DNA methyltransferase [Thalassococcus lentus]|uniref:Methyltransferase domain-containing protein n=1 Tax=Thalassococcus lentus TaxID=1210524 RepID=A0ABT4XXX5_9RHOB|nr:methyltransferase domain-containing protein [Thalassococcus lentus]MDA7426811.1 methyltransferase domain-containing protein [Thalassococcus lentus]
MSDKPSLDAAYSLQGQEDNKRLYADWATTYDSGFAEQMGYRLPDQVARVFAAAGGCGPVLDVGAGTGLLGQALVHLGLGPIDGTDLSAEMLRVAKEKQVYSAVFTGDLLDRLPVDDGAYQGAVSSGTFTHGHVGPEALAEVCRTVCSGGLMALSVNAAHWVAGGFEAAVHALKVQGVLSESRTEQVQIYDGSGQIDDAHAADTALVLVMRKA